MSLSSTGSCIKLGFAAHLSEAHPRMCCEISSQNLGSHCPLLSLHPSLTISIYLQEPALVTVLCSTCFTICWACRALELPPGLLGNLPNHWRPQSHKLPFFFILLCKVYVLIMFVSPPNPSQIASTSLPAHFCSFYLILRKAPTPIKIKTKPNKTKNAKTKQKMKPKVYICRK